MKAEIRKSNWDHHIALVHLLHRGSQIAEECLGTELGRVGLPALTSRQILVLQALDRFQTCTQVALTRHTGIDRSTLADLVRRMKAKGWVVRKRSTEDAREQLVRISPLGRTILETAQGVLVEAERSVLGKLTPQQGQAMMGALRSLWDVSPVDVSTAHDVSGARPARKPRSRS